MPDDKKNNAACESFERWRGVVTTHQEVINNKLDSLLLRMDTMIRECSKRHCNLEHRLTAVEHCGKSLTGRMAGLTKILIGSVVVIVGTAAAVALFVR